MKHLLVADLSKRYGNLKGGVEDIKQHRWFSKVDWKNLLAKKLQVFYKPNVKYVMFELRNAGDTSNFNNYPDSDTLPPALKPTEDPFIDW